MEPRPRRSGRRGRRRSRAEGLEQRHVGVARRTSGGGRARSRPGARRRRRRVGAGVDPVGGQAHPPGDGHVGGREPELAAPAVAVDHRSADLEGPAEQVAAAAATSPAASSARGSRWTSRHGRPSPPGLARPRPSTSNPSSAPIRSSMGTSPPRSVAEVEVGADDHEPRAERASTSTSRTKSSADSWLRASSKCEHEARRRGSRSRRAARASARASVSSSGADSGRTTSAGWRSKVTHTRVQAARVREVAHEPQHRLVPEVHAVVRTDRDDAPPDGVGDRRARSRQDRSRRIRRRAAPPPASRAPPRRS